MLKDFQDAFGHEIHDHLKNVAGHRPILEIVERDDGYIDASGVPGAYFSEYRHWPLYEKKAMKYVRGRVLDIGCGAGRCGLYLQRKGLEVTGIDNSPLAVEVCKKRGLKNVEIVSITQLSRRFGTFDTVLMMGNNFGLFGSFEGARRLLKKLGSLTSERGRIVAETNDVYQTDNPDHLSYHERNIKRGRMGGQIKMRVRYRKYVTPWFDYLMVSKDELERILEGTGWRVSRYIDSEGSVYIAVIDKKR